MPLKKIGDLPKPHDWQAKQPPHGCFRGAGGDARGWNTFPVTPGTVIQGMVMPLSFED